MGYNASKRLLIENHDLLESIFLHVQRGKVLSIRYPAEDIGRQHFYLNRILKSTEFFVDYENGRYKDLRSQVIVREDPATSCITVTPKAGATHSIVRATWKDALDEARTATDSIIYLKFYESDDFDLIPFSDYLTEMGYSLVEEPLSTMEDGLMTWGAHRTVVKPRSAFDRLKEGGYGGEEAMTEEG